MTTTRILPITGTATHEHIIAANAAAPMWNCCQKRPKYIGMFSADENGPLDRPNLLCGSCAWSAQAAGVEIYEMPQMR